MGINGRKENYNCVLKILKVRSILIKGNFFKRDIFIKG